MFDKLLLLLLACTRRAAVCVTGGGLIADAVGGAIAAGHLHRLCLARVGLESGESFACRRQLLVEASDDATRRVVLIERVRELLASGLQLLTQREAVQHHRVPLVLHALEQRWYARGRRRLGLDNAAGGGARPTRARAHLDVDELIGAERLLIHRIHVAVLVQVLDYETLLEHIAGHGRDDRLLRHFTAHCT